jgi:hypothetical protein
VVTGFPRRKIAELTNVISRANLSLTPSKAPVAVKRSQTQRATPGFLSID